MQVHLCTITNKTTMTMNHLYMAQTGHDNELVVACMLMLKWMIFEIFN